MKLISGILTRLVLLSLMSFSAIANAAVHQETASPSGRYKLASESVYQKTPKTLKDCPGMEIGSKISLVGRDSAVISTCFLPGHGGYPDVPKISGRDNWQTKAYWNDDETRVAVYSGGNTWSRIDFYSVIGGIIAILPHPNWDELLFDIPGYDGEATRLYEGFSKWTKNDTCAIEVNGTAKVDEAHNDAYPQFSYIVTIRVTLDGIQFVQVKKEDG
jgi:hypothetical protein